MIRLKWWPASWSCPCLLLFIFRVVFQRDSQWLQLQILPFDSCPLLNWRLVLTFRIIDVNRHHNSLIQLIRMKIGLLRIKRNDVPCAKKFMPQTDRIEMPGTRASSLLPCSWHLNDPKPCSSDVSHKLPMTHMQESCRGLGMVGFCPYTQVHCFQTVTWNIKIQKTNIFFMLRPGSVFRFPTPGK